MMNFNQPINKNCTHLLINICLNSSYEAIWCSKLSFSREHPFVAFFGIFSDTLRILNVRSIYLTYLLVIVVVLVSFAPKLLKSPLLLSLPRYCLFLIELRYSLISAYIITCTSFYGSRAVQSYYHIFIYITTSTNAFLL